MKKSSLPAITYACFLAAAVAQTPATRVTNDDWLDEARISLSEVTPRNNEEYARMTPAFKEQRLTQIRQAVQAKVIKALNQGEGTTAVGGALRALGTLVVPPGNFYHDSLADFPVELRGIQGLVVGYPIYYGGGALATTRVVIDGYRNTGGGYELAAETGQALENCALNLTQLESPRPNEAWFLARGHLYSYSYNTYHEVARIYSFDGYQFRELWAPEAPLDNPEFKVSKDSVVVTYGGAAPSGDRHPLLQETVRLTVNGAISTTLTLAP